VSFAAAFDEHPPSASPREAAFSLFVNGQHYAARTERYRLIRNFAECDRDRATGQPRPLVELYDVVNDPCHLHNLADDPAHADGRQAMSDLLWDHLEAVDDPILRGPVPTPTYRRAIAAYHQRS